MIGFDRDGQGVTGTERLWLEIVGHDYEARMQRAHEDRLKLKAARRAELNRLEDEKVSKVQDLLIKFQAKEISSLELDNSIKALCGTTQRQWLRG